MKEFDPNHVKWQICCCRVTKAAYLIGSVELLVAVIVTMTTVPLCHANAVHGSSKILYATAAGVAVVWSVGEVFLLCDIRLRNVERLTLYVFVQGVIFILMLFLIISIFLAKQLRQSSDGADEVTYSVSLFSILMALFFAAGATAVTIYSIYVLLLLKRYIEAERKHQEITKQIQNIVVEQQQRHSAAIQLESAVYPTGAK